MGIERENRLDGIESEREQHTDGEKDNRNIDKQREENITEKSFLIPTEAERKRVREKEWSIIQQNIMSKLWLSFCFIKFISLQRDFFLKKERYI